MKKHLIAAAVAAAVAAPAAFAQTSVSVYGGLDMGVRSYDQDGQSKATASAGNTIYTSRLGFRGTEDLGGGLRAIFTLEAGLGGTSTTSGSAGPAAGVVGGSTFAGTAATLSGDSQNYTPAGSVSNAIFSREASLALAGSFGEIRVGRTDLSGTEGVDTFVGNGHMGNLTFIPGSSGNIRTGNVAGELGGDVPDAVRYTSPTFNGIQVQVGRGLAANANAITKPASGSTGPINSISAQYTAGPLGLIAGQEERSGSAGQQKDKYSAFGARYDFKVVSVGAMYAKRAYAAGGEDTKWTVLSARAPLANGFAAHLSYREADVAATTSDTKNTNVGVSKALSKRTTLYGIYTKNDSKTDTNDFNELIVNVVHTF